MVCRAYGEGMKKALAEANALISLAEIGGRSRIRTYDPLIKSQLLCQLSYAPAGGGI